MSRSKRDTQLRKSKELAKERIWTHNNASDQSTQLDEFNTVKYVCRYGNKRKYEAMKKVIARRSERKKLNKFDTD